MKKMIACRWKKRLIWIISILLFSLLCTVAIHEKWVDLGIDTLTREEKHWTMPDLNGQLHLHSSKSIFHVQDSITLTLNTAYFDLLEQAQRAEYIYFRLNHSEYLDVIVNDASESYPVKPLPAYKLPGGTPREGAIDQSFVFYEFDPNNLVYVPIDGKIERDSLPYEITITIKVKPGEPEGFEDELMIWTGAIEDLTPGPDYIPVYSSQKESRIFVRIVKDGDTVKIYA